MRLMNNPEIRRLTAVHIAITAAFSGACAVFSIPAALISAAMGLALLCVNLASNARRYGEISRLCDDIDRVLLSDERICFSDCSEGELSILRSEIQKLTVRLREQNAALQDDKTLMKNAMADISHQLKTPLTSMNLIVSMLGEPGLTRRATIEYLQNLTGLLNRTQWLIDVLLKLSQFDAGVVKLQSVRLDCAGLIRSAIAPLEISAELKDVALELNIADGAGFTGDFRWSVEAFGNILKNCVEHTPSGGKITVTAEESALSTEIVISDTGGGICEEDLPHIFERFYRADVFSKQGYGIGLALARRIITAQDGTVKACNGRSGGAVFRICMYKSVI